MDVFLVGLETLHYCHILSPFLNCVFLGKVFAILWNGTQENILECQKYSIEVTYQISWTKGQKHWWCPLEKDFLFRDLYSISRYANFSIVIKIRSMVKLVQEQAVDAAGILIWKSWVGFLDEKNCESCTMHNGKD